MAHSAWILRACINGDRLLSLEAKSEVNKLPLQRLEESLSQVIA